MTGDLKIGNAILDAAEDLPTDPEEIAKLIGEVPDEMKQPSEENTTYETDDEARAAEGAQQGAAATAGQTKAAAEQGGAAKTGEADPAMPEGETKPDGILAKDGKHYLPYDVLRDARSQNLELKSRIEELTQELERARAGGDSGDTAAVGEDIKALQDQLSRAVDDYPELEDTLKGVNSAIDKLSTAAAATQKQQQEAEKVQRQQARTAQTEAQLSVDEALDQVPALREWEKKQPAIYSMAYEIDSELRDDPQWKDKPLVDRFREVERRTREQAAQALGIELPAPKEGAQPADGSPRTDGDKLLEDIDKGGVPAPKVNSLSDIGGGAAPATEQRDFGSVSQHQLAADLERRLANTSGTDAVDAAMAFVAGF